MAQENKELETSEFWIFLFFLDLCFSLNSVVGNCITFGLSRLVEGGQTGKASAAGERSDSSTHCLPQENKIQGAE